MMLLTIEFFDELLDDLPDRPEGKTPKEHAERLALHHLMELAHEHCREAGRCDGEKKTDDRFRQKYNWPPPEPAPEGFAAARETEER